MSKGDLQAQPISCRRRHETGCATNWAVAIASCREHSCQLAIAFRAGRRIGALWNLAIQGERGTPNA